MLFFLYFNMTSNSTKLFYKSVLSNISEENASVLSHYLLQDPADPLSGSIFVVLGVPGQQLQDSLPAIGQLGEHIGEGAPPVDGKVEFPLSLGHSEEREELLPSLRLSGVRESETEGEIRYIPSVTQY